MLPKRQPQPVKVRDGNMYGVICAGQLLYMHNLLDRVDERHLRALVGSEFWLSSAEQKLLLEYGFNMFSYGTYDLRQAADRYEYWLAFLQAGDPTIHDCAFMRHMHTLQQPHLQELAAIEEKYAPSISSEPRPPTMADLNNCLNNGWDILLTPLVPGTSRVNPMLVYGRAGAKYLLYSCEDDTSTVTADDLLSYGTLSFTAWKAPVKTD